MDHSFYSDRDITENYLDGPTYSAGPAHCSGPTTGQLLYKLREPTPDWVLAAPGGWQAPSDLTGRLGHNRGARHQAAPAPHTAPLNTTRDRTVTR